MWCTRLALCPLVLSFLCGSIQGPRALAGEEGKKEKLKKELLKEALKRREALMKKLAVPDDSRLGTSEEPAEEEPEEAPGKLPEKVYNLDAGELDLIESPQSLFTRDIDPREEVTLIVKLQHISTGYASKTLQSLLAREGESKDLKLHIVTVEWAPKLILTGKAALIDYALRILHALDAAGEGPEPEPEEPSEPERVVHIIDVEHVDAQELSKLITEFLKKAEKRVESPSPVRRTARARLRTRIQYHDVYETAILVDARTQKLIVKTFSKQDLQDILMLVEELDVPIQ